MERNNMFKYATKELSQDAFLCWFINFLNLDEKEYKEDAKKLLELIAEKIGETEFSKFIKEGKYNVEIMHQYKNIDILIKIGKFYIIIEDKIFTLEHDNQISEYEYKLINEGIEEKNIFTCYYKMYGECKLNYSKKLNCIITREDMLEILKNIKNKNLYMQDYYLYLLEIDKYSKERDIKISDISKQKSDILKNVEGAVYTEFYSELEQKEKNIVGWGYADNRSGGTWWYASKIFNNVQSKEFNNIYAELDLKGTRNKISIKLLKKSKEVIISNNEKIENVIKEKEYLENGKVKYYETKKLYFKSLNNKETEYRCYKILKLKEDIYDKVITKELLEKLNKYGIEEKKNVKRDNNSTYKYYSRIASIDVNEYTLAELEEILEIINNHLSCINIKIEQ